MTYTYDALYRLQTAVTNGSVAYPQWGLSWSYDRYGNRTAQNVTLGSGPSNAVTVNPATNRLTDPGYSYDANGNMTADGVNAMVYDAENHVVTNTQAGAVSTYTYDGTGLRVKKIFGGTATTVYIFSGAKVIAEYANGAAPASPTREYIYSGGALIAVHDGATLKFQMSDHLSTRLTTDSTGNVVATSGHFPFGENWYESGGTNKLKFTTYERDAESGNDFAMARYHVNRLGRFGSPDPLAGSIGNPQSLNRYAYVGNDPVNLVDPLGLLATSEILNGWNYNGGGGGTCLIDGVESPCAVAYALLRGGAAAALPPGVAPSGFINGHPYHLTLEGNDANFSVNYPGLTDAQIETLGLPTSLAGGDPGGNTSGDPANKGKGCSAKQAVSFIHTNQAAAATVAQQLNVPTQNVLGLSGIESTWGTSNAAIQANNFFGLHGGANAPFATGVWYTSGGVAMSSFPSYLASAQSFAAQYGSFVNGVANPTAFAQALVKAGFNPGTAPLGNPNFVRDTAATINATARRMQCP